MFSNDLRQTERTRKYGTPRQEHLQDLVTKFQNAKSEEEKEKVAANLANFAYDPYNYVFLRQLNVLKLFIDCLTEPSDPLIESGATGSATPSPSPRMLEHGRLSGHVRNTVKYAIAGLYYLLESGCCDWREILKTEVVELIWNYAEANGGGTGFGNLARVLLDKHCADPTAY